MGSLNKVHFGYQVQVKFPHSEDSVLVKESHLKQMAHQMTSLPIKEAVKICGLAHSIHVGQGQACPDNVLLTFYQEGLDESGKFCLTEVYKEWVSSPGKPLGLAFVRSFVVKAWPKKGGEDTYVLSYDGYNFSLTSPRFQSVYLPRSALIMQPPPPLPGSQSGLKRPTTTPPGEQGLKRPKTPPQGFQNPTPTTLGEQGFKRPKTPPQGVQHPTPTSQGFQQASALMKEAEPPKTPPQPPRDFQRATTPPPGVFKTRHYPA